MNIYVGNLSFSATEDEVRQAFGAYGAVKSVSIIKDRDTGKSRGFGFVEMPNDGEGQAAITALNGKMLGGRALVVNEARPREDRGGGGYDRRGGGQGGQRRSGGGFDRRGGSGNSGYRD